MIRRRNIVIVSYKSLPNPIVDSLKVYLFENFHTDLLDITHPLLESKKSFARTSRYEFYKNGKLLKSYAAFHWKFPAFLLYIKDFVYSVYWCLLFFKVWDVYFGVGNLNPVVGIILKQFKLVKKVVYYSMDYYPSRFENKLLNKLYFQIDKFCVRFADETWNVSSTMVKAREKNSGMNNNIFNKQYVVPGGVWVDKIKKLPFNKINKNKIVYRGMLNDFQGIDLAIKAIPLIVKSVPKLKFEIMGEGSDEVKLKRLVKALGLRNYVIFHGLIENRKELEKIMSDGSLGIATFNTKILDDKITNADPGKIKDYMSVGMPVITTSALSYYQELLNLKCGFVVKYDPNEFAKVVVEYLSSLKMQKVYRRNVSQFIKNYDWNRIFSKNLPRVLY